MDINHDTKKLFMYAILCLSLAVGLSRGYFPITLRRYLPSIRSSAGF